ncbi:MAG: HAD hydrolase-like protein [Nitrososphaeria archaeon]
MSEKVLVLDFDGVIVKLNVEWPKVYSKISELAGYPVTDLITFWKNMFGTELYEKANKIIEEYEMNALPKSTIYPDVHGALKIFNGTIYLASMQSQKVLESFLEKNELKAYFKEVLGRERFGVKRKQLEYILEKERGNKIYFIDDLQRNIDNCDDLNIKCILIRRSEGETLLQKVKEILEV